jgi:hypothetical protein
MEENENLTNLPLQSEGQHDKDSINFYNSIHLEGKELKKALKQTNTQAGKILAFLEKYPFEKFTRCEIRKQLIECGAISPITQESTVGARLTDLRKLGKIIKHSELKDEIYGKPNHLWQLAEPLAVVNNHVSPGGTQAEIF